MANVKQLALCPYCKAELPHPIPQSCPACKRALSGPENPHFASPEYLSYQYDELQKQYDAMSRAHDAKPMGQDDAKKWREIQAHFRRWLRDCPDEDKICALRDATFVMMNVVHSSATPSAISSITKLAKQIGKLGEALDNYYRFGGETHDPEVGRVQADAGDTGGGEETPFGSGRAP